MTSKSSFLTLSTKDADTVSNLLARAFFDYPAMRNQWPDDTERAKVLPWYLGISVRIALQSGKILATPDMQGAAIWLPIENTDIPITSYIRHGLWQLPFRMKPSSIKRMFDNDLYVEKLRKTYAPSTFYYLWVIGVEPSSQRTGLGQSLITPMLEEADKQGKACFLETHKFENVDYYRKFGFEVAHAGRVPKHDWDVWVMLRPPATD